VNMSARPKGLVSALWLTRMGMRLRFVDMTTDPGTTSRGCRAGTDARAVLPNRTDDAVIERE
jgi:hypothetical protein